MFPFEPQEELFRAGCSRCCKDVRLERLVGLSSPANDTAHSGRTGPTRVALKDHTQTRCPFISFCWNPSPATRGTATGHKLPSVRTTMKFISTRKVATSG
ncbi:hypothetical protein ILYODFUR_015296 [Ilyodon furcidens]|uniref:Uncharacterized protein n=1 Tax=Ilyodon furcidens TaxID=33524 RepID=A0ABV0VFS0_9TELE